MADVWNFAAENAREHGPESCWHRIFCYLHEIEQILGSRLGVLRETNSIAGFVRDLLGERYGVHPQQIKRAMQSGVRTISAKEMLGLVQLAIPSASVVSKQAPVKSGAGGRGGKKKGFSTDDTQDRILLAAALEVAGTKSTYSMAPVLYPLGPHRTRDAAESAMRWLRKRKAVEIQTARSNMSATRAAEIIRTIRPTS